MDDRINMFNVTADQDLDPILFLKIIITTLMPLKTRAQT